MDKIFTCTTSQLVVDPDIRGKLKTMRQIWLKDCCHYRMLEEVFPVDIWKSRHLIITAWFRQDAHIKSSKCASLIRHQFQSKKNQPILCYSHSDLAPYPSLCRLALTLISLPPPTPPLAATPAAPPCAASPRDPRCPLIWSDTATYSRRRSSTEKAELSQSPCGVQPSVPVFLWFSHHWAKPHGSSSTLHAELTVVPPKLPACPPWGVLFFGGAQEDGFQLQGR